MAENTKIEWADHTFNPWIGCQKVSWACDHCYAETLMDTRLGQVEWGPGKPRKRTSEANWRLPHKWNRQAEKAGKRARVFCASLADVFDNAVPRLWRADLWQLIDDTPHLIWMLLTKRPENIRKLVPFHSWQPNVWLGTTAEDQPNFDRRWRALKREDAVVRFISYEPALGPLSVIGGDRCPDWVICGGESGQGARPMHPGWPRALREECVAAGIPYHFKQWGEWLPGEMDRSRTGPPHYDMPDAVWQDGTEGHYWDAKHPYYAWTAEGEPVLIPTVEDQEPFREKHGGPETLSVKVGKKRAGRMLDGREWNGMPA